MLIGWFGDIVEMAKPGKLEKVKALAGLDFIIPESSVWHTSGFRISPEMAASGPLEDWRTRPELGAYRQAHHQAEHIYIPFPGVVAGAGDAQLRGLIQEAHRLGVQVWGHLGMWSYGASAYRDYLLETLWGKPLAEEWWTWGDPFCPSRREINEWARACLIEVIQEYPIDGINYDHVRIAPPTALGALLGCACPSCQARAYALGYDFEYMRSDVFAFLRELRGISPERLEALASSNLGITDFLSLLGDFPGVLDWFNFRCELLAEEFGGYQEAAFSVAREGFHFGCDVLPPSIAFLGGQSYPLWESVATYITGGAESTLIGWGAAPLVTCLEWAKRLAPKLDGAKALSLMYRLFGLEGVEGLPQSLEEAPARLADSELRGKLRVHQFRKMKALTTGAALRLAPVALSLELPEVQVQCRAIGEEGLEGALFSGPLEEPKLRAIGSLLKG